MFNEKIPYDNNRYYNEHLKNFEKTRLKKEASGLGFYVFTFAITMTVTYLILLSVALFFDSSVAEPTSIPSFLLQIFCSVFAAFIPGLFYILLSQKHIADVIEVKRVCSGLLIPIVFIGLGAAMVANATANIVAQNFYMLGLENTVDFDYSSNSAISNILYVVATAVVPAFSEEFAFRGIVMGSLRKYGDALAIIISSVLFGIMHGNIIQIPFAFILGLIFAFIDCKTNSIIPSIIIHFINNLYSVILNILYSSGLLKESQYYAIMYFTVVAFCLLGIFSFIKLIKKDKNFFKISDISPVNQNSLLTFKEKNSAVFSSPGIILCLILFTLETIDSLGGLSA